MMRLKSWLTLLELTNSMIILALQLLLVLIIITVIEYLLETLTLGWQSLLLQLELNTEVLSYNQEIEILLLTS
ncbi:hypothetical protein D9M68_279840 [compost metagenome]